MRKVHQGTAPWLLKLPLCGMLPYGGSDLKSGSLCLVKYALLSKLSFSSYICFLFKGLLYFCEINREIEEKLEHCLALADGGAGY